MYSHYNGKAGVALASHSNAEQSKKYTNMHLLDRALSHDQNKCHTIGLVSFYLHTYPFTKATAMKILGVQFYLLSLGTKFACYSYE